MLGDVSAIQLDSPSHRGGEKREGDGMGSLSVLLGSPLDNRLPHHGSSPKEEGRNKWNMTMTKYEEVTDINVTDRI